MAKNIWALAQEARPIAKPKAEVLEKSMSVVIREFCQEGPDSYVRRAKLVGMLRCVVHNGRECWYEEDPGESDRLGFIYQEFASTVESMVSIVNRIKEAERKSDL